jgi:hypothetical protein
VIEYAAEVPLGWPPCPGEHCPSTPPARRPGSVVIAREPAKAT